MVVWQGRTGQGRSRRKGRVAGQGRAWLRGRDGDRADQGMVAG
jgi:hypothetical protein